MWKIKHIFDGEFGCEERADDQEGLMVSVTLTNEDRDEKYVTVADEWLRENGLDVGSEWPDDGEMKLVTQDLILKKAVRSDWREIYENLWRHAESAKYMLWEPTESEEEAVARMERTIGFQKKNKYAFFIYEKATEKAIGFAGMKEVRPHVYEDTGIALGPDYVRKGYGTQVLNAFLEEARRNGAKKFIASCRVCNLPAHEMQMKLGFRFSHFEDRVDARNGEAYVLEFNEKE